MTKIILCCVAGMPTSLFVEKTDIPVMVIDMRDYGMMNVKKVLPEILSLVKK